MLTPRYALIALSALPLCAAACGAAQDDVTAEDAADSAQLDEYRSALPDADTVSAPVLGDEPDPNALTVDDKSELAKLAAETAIGINRPARLIVATLRTITKLKPTSYDEEAKAYTWGPWGNDDGYGQVLVYIKKLPEGADFTYEYALVRLTDDPGSETAVIWGGATPGAGEPTDGVRAAGVTLWDFEANRAFEAAYDPDFDENEVRDRGRFAMLFGRGAGDEGSFRFNVAAFRDFVPKDAEPGAAPADLDYYYGHLNSKDGYVLDFVDWDLTGNLCGADTDSCFENASEEDLASGNTETLSLSAAFIDRRLGRGEATILGGDLSAQVDVVECWSKQLETDYVSVSSDGELVAETGACDAPFDQTLAALGVPTLADIDADVLKALDCAATSGAACKD